jgi:outer membrane protein
MTSKEKNQDYTGVGDGLLNFGNYMKKIILVGLVFLNFGLASQGQMAFVDTKYILNKMPDYRDSLMKINQMSVIWQKEIDDKQAVVDKMHQDFERDEVMLSDELKKKRADDLFYHEKEVRDLQRSRFGFEGDLFKKRLELLKPLEDSVNNAIQKTATRLTFKIILDRSQGITVMYADPKLDITREVLRDMGIP